MLPLVVGNKWVLKSTASKKPLTFEVVAKEAVGYRIRCTHLGGVAEWVLSENAGQFRMLGYTATGGTGASVVPLPDQPLFLDFVAPVGATWTNMLGQMKVDSVTATIAVPKKKTYQNCRQIRQSNSGGSVVMSFASGVGYVAYGSGSSPYLLDEAASVIQIPVPPPPPPPVTVPTVLPKFGITANRYAYEPFTVSVMNQRFQQTLDAGVSLLVGSGEWAALEPQVQTYSLSATQDFINTAKASNLQVLYTLRVVNTVARDVPTDLKAKAWNDPLMKSRLLDLITKLAPILKGQTKWVTIGYEMDGYFNSRPQEVAAFVELFKAAKAKFKELMPGVEVSTTLTHFTIGSFPTSYASLNAELDFVSVNYSPLRQDLTVAEPYVIPVEFQAIKQTAAGRKVVLQEIACPSGTAAGSSLEKQAEVFRTAFQEIWKDTAAFAAVNVMMLSDLSDADTQKFAEFYGLQTESFKSALQTLGLHNTLGQAKPAWAVVTDYASRR